MKILLWHGYLLTGTGANVYTANVARSWRRRGHEVLLLCQELHPERLDFVDEAGRVDGSSMSLRPLPAAPARGRCVVANPDIGRLLPVYVYDAYEGFDAKLFTDLSDAELQHYVDRNAVALVNAIRTFGPDMIVVGHEVMGPYIARSACAATGSQFMAKLHGSALEYAVKKQARYRDFAVEGLSAATCVVGGSGYMIREAAAHIPGWEDKAVVVNPGCDIDLFRPIPRRDSAGTVGYVGKLIASKGVQDLLLALPLVASMRHAVIVGYGSQEEELRDLASVLSGGDLRTAVAIVDRIGPERRDLAAFLERRPSGYEDSARRMDISFTGRLEHGPLARVLPTFDVLAVPSVVPEAFGMVAAEAAAAGVLPVVPNHSGIGEAGAAVEEAIGHPGLLTYDPADGPSGLAAALDRVLSLPMDERVAAEQKAVELARSRWSWDHVANALLRHASFRSGEGG